jgi:head-tail adaptor
MTKKWIDFLSVTKDVRKKRTASIGSSGAEKADRPTVRFVIGYLNANTERTIPVSRATIHAETGV